MAVATFTARRRIATGHLYGQQYSVVFKMQKLDPSSKARMEETRSMSGASEGVVHGVDQEWTIVTDYLAPPTSDYVREFLNSVVGAYTFTFDADAQSLDASGNPVAVSPVQCELADDTFTDQRAKKKGFWEFGFKIREIGDPRYATNYYLDVDLTKFNNVSLVTNPDILPGWSYTRSGVMYALRPDGIFHAYSADMLVSHYDLINGREKGVWLGAATTNSAKYSADISNAAWQTTGVTKAAATSIIEAGTAQKLTASSAGAVVYQGIGNFSVNKTTAVAFVERGNATACYVGLYDTTTSVMVGRVKLDFTTSTITAYDGSDVNKVAHGYKLMAVGPNGSEVWALAITCTGTNGDALRLAYYPVELTDAASYSFLHYAELSASNAFPMIDPPVVTAGASVTRGADIFTYTGLPAYLTYATEMTLAAEFTLDDAITSTTLGFLLNVCDNTNSNRHTLSLLLARNGTSGTTVTAGATQANASRTSTLIGKHKTAYRARLNDFAHASDGVLSAKDALGSMPAGLNMLAVGRSQPNGGNEPCCYLSRFVFAPTGWDDATLASWTT